LEVIQCQLKVFWGKTVKFHVSGKSNDNAVNW